MNLCYLYGRIIGKIEFEFIINSKNKSIAIFKLELFNKSIITIKAYNELADYCYSKLKDKDCIRVEGYINTNMEVVSNYIKQVNFKIGLKVKN